MKSFLGSRASTACRISTSVIASWAASRSVSIRGGSGGDDTIAASEGKSSQRDLGETENDHSDTSLATSPAENSSSAKDITGAGNSSGASSLQTSGEPRTELDPTKFYDDSPVRPTGKWAVTDVIDKENMSLDYAAIDDIESYQKQELQGTDTALVVVEDELYWKNKLMFVHGFEQTPKHMTWLELAQEIECLDCAIDPDDDKPEEIYHMKFWFRNKMKGTRTLIWEATNDVSHAEGLTDLLAACGSCMSRADVHRTIRFDDGLGTTRDLNIRKRSRYTSEVSLAFRPTVKENVYDKKEGKEAWEQEMEEQGLSTWGFHPEMMDPEYRDTQDPEGTYHLALSAHAFTFAINRAVERLVTRPLKDFYRASQLQRTLRMKKKEDLGVIHAVSGWLGMEDKLYPHYTPMEAIQEHWLGPDCPFTLTAIFMKTREMTYQKKKNPEYESWLSVRQHDSALAVRNIKAKMLGAGASTLFTPLSHNATTNQLLPKSQRRDIKATVSIGGMLGMADETRKISELKKITGVERISEGSSRVGGLESSSTTNNSNSEGKEEKVEASQSGDKK